LRNFLSFHCSLVIKNGRRFDPNRYLIEKATQASVPYLTHRSTKSSAKTPFPSRKQVRYAGEQTLFMPAFMVIVQSQPLVLVHRKLSNISMEINVVTQIRSSTAKSKRASRTLNGINDMPDATLSQAHRSRKSVAKIVALRDEPPSDVDEVTQKDRHSAAATQKVSHFVTRGRDFVSGNAASVATATAIFVGAALIEVELLPGLIIGAGAILLGKLLPKIGAYVRPTMKGALQAGFFMTQKAREVMAETSEQVHDLVAEVKHEQNQPKAE
jgi:hypothetical protein